MTSKKIQNLKRKRGDYMKMKELIYLLLLKAKNLQVQMTNDNSSYLEEFNLIIKQIEKIFDYCNERGRF